MDVHLSEDWQPFIRAQIESGRYASADQILDEALRLLQQRELKESQEKGRIEALLTEGLDSGPSTPMTSDDWDQIEHEGQRIIATRKER
jgi:antitoxin ParD1/3/4